MNAPLTAPLTEDSLRLIAIIQRLVYRTIRMTLGEGKEKRPEKFEAAVDLLGTWCQRMIDSKEVAGALVIFDETIWPPSEPQRHGTVVQVILAVRTTTEYVTLEIDLTKGYRDCAALLVPGEPPTPINPFHVEFPEELD